MFKKIYAGILSALVFGAALPVSGTILPEFSITASAAEENTDGTYGDLTYINYGDYIEITDCDESAETVEIPSEIDGVPVTSIGDYAFGLCKRLTSITIPDGVTSIGGYAFSLCKSLTSITIPDGVTSIGGSAFSDCYNLTSITIPESVTSIGDSAFSGCESLTSITIPDGVTSIGYGAFYYCTSLTSITIPNGVTSIGDDAFSDCYNLTSITIPEGVTSIGDSAFEYCKSLTSITIPDGVTSIGDDAFSDCYNLTSITIPESVTSIGDSAFGSCKSLTSINIQNPDCEIYDSEYTIYNYDEDNGSVFTGTIYGYDNSTAQEYAEKYGRNFVSLGEDPKKVIYGDANGDGVLGISDVVKVMMYASDKETYPMTDEELDAADVSNRGDGVFVSDALSIQKKLAQVIDTLPESYM